MSAPQCSVCCPAACVLAPPSLQGQGGLRCRAKSAPLVFNGNGKPEFPCQAAVWNSSRSPRLLPVTCQALSSNPDDRREKEFITTSINISRTRDVHIVRPAPYCRWWREALGSESESNFCERPSKAAVIRYCTCHR